MVQGMKPFDRVKIVYARGNKTKKLSTLLGAKRIFVEKNKVCCDLLDDSLDIDKISLYPNPATTEITLTFKDGSPDDVISFEIFSMEGVKQISKKDQKLDSSISKKINLETLADGAYVIRIAKGKKVYSRQIIIVK